MATVGGPPPVPPQGQDSPSEASHPVANGISRGKPFLGQPEAPSDATLVIPVTPAEPPQEDPSAPGLRLVLRFAPVLFLFFASAISVGAARDQLIIGWICDGLYPPTDPASGEPDSEMSLADPIDRCNTTAVQTLSSKWLIAISLSFNIPTVVMMTVYGWLSDHGWRKHVMFAPVIGFVLEKLSVIFLSLAPPKSDGLPPYILPVLCLGTVVNGLLGSFQVIAMSAFASIADVTPPAGRTLNISRMEAVFMSAFTVGPAVGGAVVRWAGAAAKAAPAGSWLADAFGGYKANFAIYWVALAADLVVLGAMYWAIPGSIGRGTKRVVRIVDEEVDVEGDEAGQAADSEPRASREEQQPLLGSPAVAAEPRTAGERARAFWTKAADALGGDNLDRTLLAIVLIVFFFKFQGNRFVFVLYTRFRFGWQTFEDGVYFSTLSLCRMACLLVLLPAAMRLCRHMPGFEVLLVRAGVWMLCLGQVMYGKAWAGWVFLTVGVVLDAPAFSLLTPTIRGLLSSSTAPTHQARLFSVIALVENVFGVASPVAFGATYAWLVERGAPHAIFYVFAGMLAVAGFVGMFVKRDMVERNHAREARAKERAGRRRSAAA